jgi:hypothetical protein
MASERRATLDRSGGAAYKPRSTRRDPMKKLATLISACALAGTSLFGSTLVGCGGALEHAVVGQHEAASADGIVRIEETGAGNRLVTIHLDNLPPPERVSAGATAYVVWFVGANAAPLKAANLAYDADARIGDAMATTTLATFELRVTAERAGEVSTPSDKVALSHRVSGGS